MEPLQNYFHSRYIVGDLFLQLHKTNLVNASNIFALCILCFVTHGREQYHTIMPMGAKVFAGLLAGLPLACSLPVIFYWLRLVIQNLLDAFHEIGGELCNDLQGAEVLAYLVGTGGAGDHCTHIMIL